jgi:hypothetical protein
MTEHKTFERRGRSRMAKPDGSYTAARRILIDDPLELAPPAPRESPLAAAP